MYLIFEGATPVYVTTYISDTLHHDMEVLLSMDRLRLYFQHDDLGLEYDFLVDICCVSLPLFS